MRVLVAGASGFIGRRIAGALTRAGHQVVAGVRDPSRYEGEALAVDFQDEIDIATWRERLTGIDAVVNAAGIVRETGRQRFELLHTRGPVALFRAGALSPHIKIIQISALGADAGAQTGFHLSKRAADDALAALAVRWVIVQPSIVFGAGGASARLFTTLASLPVVPVPGDGSQRLQPIHVDDLADAVVRLLADSRFDGTRLPAVGPQPIALRALLLALRRAMSLARAPVLDVPLSLVRWAARMGEQIPGAVLTPDTLGMLLRGNTAPADAITAVLGRAPRPVERFVAPEEARHWSAEARLGWLLPLVRVSLAFVWIAAGVVSLGLYPTESSYALLARVGLTGALAVAALYGAAALDLALGFATLLLRRRRWLWRAQIALVLAYSATVAVALPEMWLHPFGPLVKNVPILAALVLLHELDGGR